MTVNAWPDTLGVTQVRFARPTDRLDEVIRFYVDGLGLNELYRFENHAGYDGVMLGLPGTDHHLEFTTHVDGSPGDAPSNDNLLVLYFSSEARMYETVERLGEFGAEPVPTENPYWAANGAIAFPDPDGWQVVLMPRPVF